MPIDTPSFPPIPVTPLFANVMDMGGLVEPVSARHDIDPCAIPNLVNYFRADSFGGTPDGTEIATWPDSSNMRQDATAVGSAGSRPTVVLNGINGLTAALFASGKRGLSNASGTISSVNVWSVWGVFQFPITASATQAGWISLVPSWRLYIEAAANIGSGLLKAAYTSIGTVTEADLIQDTVWHYCVFTCNGATKKLWIDGTLRSFTTVLNNGSITSGFRIGEQYDGGTGVGWIGKIAEVGIVDRAMTTEEAVALNAYLAGRYGL